MISPRRDRRSIRLSGYDYSSAGFYFVTICTFRRAALFGEIRGAKMNPSDLGTLIESVWRELPDHFPSVTLDAFVIMPNHLHGIVALHSVALARRAETSSAPTDTGRAPALARVIQGFKSLAYTRAKRQLGRAGPLWQRNYFEHIVRTGDGLTTIQRYIWENPLHWEFDRENPHTKQSSRRRIEPWDD